MSLRSLIEAKARRSATIPIIVGDVAAAVAEVNMRRSALAAYLSARPAPADGDGQQPAGAEPATGEQPVDEREQQLRAERDEAIAARNACAVYVKVQALPGDEWDAALDGLPDDDAGGPDIGRIRAALMAACCVDPDLQDEAWWADQFARPHWSKGELTAVNMALLQLNYAAPTADAGKG